MNETAKNLKEKLEKVRNQLIPETVYLQNLSGNHRDSDVSDLVDIGYLLREISKLYDGLRKEADRTLKQVNKTIGLRILERNAENPMSATDSAKGSLASGKIRITQQPILPKQGTKEHKELLEELGIVDPLGITKVHWPNLCNYLTTNLEEGGKGLKSVSQDDVFKEIQVTYRKKVKKAKSDV